MTSNTQVQETASPSDHTLAIATVGFVYAPLVLVLIKALSIASS